MNQVAIRTILIVLHAAANFVVVTKLLDFDLTSSWLRFIGFIAAIGFLMYLFIIHILSYIYFIKTKTK